LSSPAEAPAARPPAPAAEAAPATGRHALWMLIASVVVALLNYGLNILLGWALPLDAYGQIGVAQTLIFVCTWFLSAGFPWLVSRAVAQARGPDAAAREAAARTFKTAWAASAVLTVAVVALLLGSYALGVLPLGAGYAPLMLLVALTVAALGLSSVPDSALQGLFRFGRVATGRVAEAATNFVLSAVLVVVGLGAPGGLAGFAAAAVLACALNVWWIRDTGLRGAAGWGGLGMLRAASVMTVAVFGGVLLTNIDLLALKFLSGAGSDRLAGTYQVAAVLARAPLFVGTALVSTFYPRIALEHARDAAVPAGRDLLRWTALGVLPINVILAAAAPAVVLFFFPARFAPAAGLLALLAVGSACLVWAGALAAIRQASGRVRGPALIMALAVTLQIVVLAWGIPAAGATGAAFASLVAALLAAGLLVAQAWRRGAPALPDGRQVLALAGLALVVLPLGLGIVPAGRLLVAAWVAAAAAVYAILCLYLGVLSPADLARVPAPLLVGRLGIVTRPALGAAGTLQRWGRRFGPGEGR